MTYWRKQRTEGQRGRSGNKNDPTRRDIMRQAACAAVGTTALVSTVWDMRMISAAAAVTAPSDYKALVCLFLYGGNDGNNLLIPTDPTTFNFYTAARSALTITQSQALA